MKDQIIAEVARLTEEDQSAITDETVLKELENWDSLARVSFLVFASENFSVFLDGKALDEAKTIAELLRLIESGKK